MVWEWLVWCAQTASCLWWPFSTYGEFLLYVILPIVVLSLGARWFIERSR